MTPDGSGPRALFEGATGVLFLDRHDVESRRVLVYFCDLIFTACSNLLAR